MNSMHAMFACEECGAVNSHDATLCFACQHPLVPSTATPSEQVTFKEVPLGNGAVAFALADSESEAALGSRRDNPLRLSEPGSTQQSETEQAQAQQVGPLTAGFLLQERYEIVEQVGQGGFGVVYKAKDKKSFNKLVAIKQISLAQLSPRDIIQATDSYNREVTLHTPLAHEHLPRIHEHFTDPWHWYLVMDFIKGETLEDYRKRKPGGKLSVREALSAGVQLCEALRYLHKQPQHGIIFRDVKPANIMRTRRGKFYLIDFGIARRFTPEKDRDTGPLGSPGYAAPEQYGMAQTTPKTDMYGLGATLHTLLTGVDPSDDTQAESSAQAHTAAIPPKVQEYLGQLMARNPNDRPTNMKAISKQLLLLRDGRWGRIWRPAVTVVLGILIGLSPYLLRILIFVVGSAISLYNEFYFFGITMLSLVSTLSIIVAALVGIILMATTGRRLTGLGMLIGAALPVITTIAAFIIFRLIHHFF
jgi:hypothetical protein